MSRSIKCTVTSTATNKLNPTDTETRGLVQLQVIPSTTNTPITVMSTASTDTTCKRFTELTHPDRQVAISMLRAPICTTNPYMDLVTNAPTNSSVTSAHTRRKNPSTKPLSITDISPVFA